MGITSSPHPQCHCTVSNVHFYLPRKKNKIADHVHMIIRSWQVPRLGNSRNCTPGATAHRPPPVVSAHRTQRSNRRDRVTPLGYGFSAADVSLTSWHLRLSIFDMLLIVEATLSDERLLRYWTIKIRRWIRWLPFAGYICLLMCPISRQLSRF